MKILAAISLMGTLTFLGSGTSVELVKPDYFPEPIYNFERNPLDVAKIKLGRALFYDPILSADNSISCASCHSPYNAFAHTDHKLSHGIGDSIGRRNAPALFNLAWRSNFMWDGSVHQLDAQALAPLTHPGEMASSLEDVVSSLRQNERYKKAFDEAYSDGEITGARVLNALAQFQLTLVSADSKYDKVKREEDEFSELEAKGYEVFKRNCNSCHTEPLFTSNGFERNGLAADRELKDLGRFELTRLAEDSLKFQVPSLRNLKYTYPYMHDGRLQNLGEVIRHYAALSVQPNENEVPLSIQLNDRESTELISFLKTLNDPTFIYQKEHEYPRDFFRNP